MNETSQEQQTPVSEKKSGTLFGIVCLVIALLIAGYFFRDTLLQKITGRTKPVPNGLSTSSTFSLEVDNTINRFIFTKIDVLSPIPAATGTMFTVSTIENFGDGKRTVVYSDTTATYTAKGVFSVPEPKKINIVSFDVISSSTALQPLDEGLQLAEAYIRAHVSELSPEKEVLGGKFYITKITFENAGNAVVEYEDGHIALRAHVSFQVDGGKNVEVLKWEMLSNK